AKLARKNLDMIVANEVSMGFASDTNRVVIVKRDGTLRHLPLMSKEAVAEAILDEVAGLLRGGKSR
ncbi:MAG: bifunctional 4'-phosphopantothenoylcysteine decarboxylase/phosphopantothenoylcysteine synthetase, partial [Aquificota bacterium]